MTPRLETRRLVLSPYTPVDEDAFVALFADEEVSRWMGDGPQTEMEDRALFGRVFTHVYATNRFDVWGVKEDGRLIGHAEIKDTTDIDGHEIIYALARETWGRGLGTELASALVTYGFEVLDLTEVHATVAAENMASLSLLEKVGFLRVGEKLSENGGRTIVLTCYREAPG